MIIFLKQAANLMFFCKHFAAFNSKRSANLESQGTIRSPNILDNSILRTIKIRIRLNSIDRIIVYTMSNHEM